MSKPRRNWRAFDGIVLLDKPSGPSSNAVLQQVRRCYNAEKAGHTGSLDPLASGLLPICLGEATKLSAHLLDADKTYQARVCLGVATATGDAEGAPVRYSDASAVTAADLERVRPQLLGAIQQIPPMYSALKRDGRHLYELAREGLEIEREPRTVVIHDLRLLHGGDGVFEFTVRCSKGTYVRTLAEDWAALLGQAAHLLALRRVAAGPFDSARLVGMEQLHAAAEQGQAALDALALPPAAGVAHWPQLVVDGAAAQRLRQGIAVSLTAAPAHGALAVLDEAGSLLGLAEIDAAGRVAPKRWLRTKDETRRS